MNKEIVPIRTDLSGREPEASSLGRNQDRCPRCDGPLSIVHVRLEWTGMGVGWGPCLYCEPAENRENPPRKNATA
jgi:hypothetical protein